MFKFKSKTDCNIIEQKKEDTFISYRKLENALESVSNFTTFTWKYIQEMVTTAYSDSLESSLTFGSYYDYEIFEPEDVVSISADTAHYTTVSTYDVETEGGFTVPWYYDLVSTNSTN